MAANDDYILQILQENILVSDDQIETARATANGRSLVDVLIEQGSVSQEDVAHARQATEEPTEHRAEPRCEYRASGVAARADGHRQRHLTQQLPRN